MNLLFKLQDWLNNRYPAARPHARLVDVNPIDLTLAGWLKHSELVHEANSLSKTPIFKAMMEVARNEFPKNYKMEIGTQATDLIRHLGEIDGYNMAINNLMAMTVIAEKTQSLEATFEQEEVKGGE